MEPPKNTSPLWVAKFVTGPKSDGSLVSYRQRMHQMELPHKVTLFVQRRSQEVISKAVTP